MSPKNQMRIMGAEWRKGGNLLVIGCDCTHVFKHPSNRWKVECTNCFATGHLHALRIKYRKEHEVNGDELAAILSSEPHSENVLAFVRAEDNDDKLISVCGTYGVVKGKDGFSSGVIKTREILARHRPLDVALWRCVKHSGDHDTWKIIGQDPMKVIVAGSRSIDNYDLIEECIQESGFIVNEVVSGGAKGVDRVGEAWAAAHRIAITRFPADWETHGKAAGPIRNGLMADYADALIAIWDGESRGTKNMIKTAERAGLPIMVWEIEEE